MGKVTSRVRRGLLLIPLFLLTTAGVPTNGIPTNGIPTNGIPTNGIPTNGIPTNGANLDQLEGSLLFGNQSVHEALIGRAFTQANLTDPSSAEFELWSDPFSTVLLSYLWQDTHALGDDLEFTDSFGNIFRFYGNLGLCDRKGTGWARDAPLDDTCARWLSAVLISQINQSGIHNLFSARGSSSDQALSSFIGGQLTDMAPAIASFDYKFGTHNPVEALRAACAPGTTGPANCGWQPGLVGTGQPGTVVKIQAVSGGVPMLLQVNQGIMGHDYPFAAAGSCFGQPPGCTDPDTLGLAVSGSVNPSVQFTIPRSRVFNVQWTALSRDQLAGMPEPSMTASIVRGRGAVRFPADELDIFPASNREMTAQGNLFGKANIDPALWSCEVRLRPVIFAPISNAPTGATGVPNGATGVPSGAPTQLCLASNGEGCTACTRSFPPGGLHVLFPNAHLWLSTHWTSAQAYYQNRSCSSDLSTCIAAFEGFIDGSFANPATGRVVPPCATQSTDRDTHRPLPYGPLARRLHDASSCFVDQTRRSLFEVTTFFPNYRSSSLGACAAIGLSSPGACAYGRGEGEGDDGDDD